MSIVTFPKTPARGVPRLLSDEQRVRTWYDALDSEAQDSWYGLHEIKNATGIPMSRLPTILWRCGWCSDRHRYIAGLIVWHGPRGKRMNEHRR